MSNGVQNSVHYETALACETLATGIPRCRTRVILRDPPAARKRAHLSPDGGRKVLKTWVHAHRLFGYSLRCIVEIQVQTYTSVAVHLSARCPQK
jgi:hypothetical protein